MAKTKACVDVTDAEIARGVGKPQIGKHVAAAAGNFDLVAHAFFAHSRLQFRNGGRPDLRG